MKTIEEIIETKEKLNQRLYQALATMERKDTIREIRLEIINNQKECPHFSDYNWAIIDGICPYCGFSIGKTEE